MPFTTEDTFTQGNN